MTHPLSTLCSELQVPPRAEGFQGVASNVFDVTEGGSFSARVRHVLCPCLCCGCAVLVL